MRNVEDEDEEECVERNVEDEQEEECGGRVRRRKSSKKKVEDE